MAEDCSVIGFYQVRRTEIGAGDSVAGADD